jgi:hypothetical protein
MPRPDAVVGELPPVLRDSVERWAGSPLVGPPDGAPRAARLLELIGTDGGARLIEDPASWEPTYGRPAEAQARWELAHGRPLPDTAGRPR